MSRYIHSRLVYGIARSAYERMKHVLEDRARDQRDAFVCVLFAAATLESVILEMGWYACHVEGEDDLALQLRNFGRIVTQIEEDRGKIELKYQVGKLLLPGRPLQSGSQPYDDLVALFQLSNSIIHMKPEPVKFEPPPCSSATKSWNLRNELTWRHGQLG